jgi:hypothetical protein
MFPGPKAGHHQREEDQEPPVVARFEKPTLFVGREESDWLRIFDGHPADSERRKRTFGMRRKMSVPRRVAEQGSTRLDDEKHPSSRSPRFAVFGWPFGETRRSLR